jgi:hypothetical protein
MAHKKRAAVTKLHEQSDCPLFKLPGELRNHIYELVFEHDDEPVNIEDAFSPFSNVLMEAAPPSSALIHTCRKLHLESKGFHEVSYRNYWRKGFIVDLWRVDALRGYIKRVPTAWIDSYIMKMEISDASASEVVLSRFGGRWHVKARTDSPYSVTGHIAKHTRRCLGLPRSNSPWGQISLLWDSLHDILYGPGFPVEKENKLNAMIGTTDMIRTRGGNSKTKSKPKYKRPKHPSKLHGCHRTNPKCVLSLYVFRFRSLQLPSSLPRGRLSLGDDPLCV